MLTHKLRDRLALAAGATLLTCLLAGAARAQASTVYACVKRNGSAHIFARKPRCRRGESRVSWSSAGPAGKNGADGKNGANGTNGASGTNGANGANGAVGGFSAGGKTSAPVKETPEVSVVGSKSVPAGHYIVFAKVGIAGEAHEAGLLGVKCSLTDAGAAIDTDYIDQPYPEVGFAKSFYTDTPLVFTGALDTTATTTLAVECEWFYDTPGGSVDSENWAITAVQTTANS